MDNHPIPQDITGFQFKLIGDMTLKQFLYLAVGVVIAWIIFSTSVNFLIKLPLSSFFALFGVSFAFLSISGRPIDTMLLNFMRATFSPTKYVYQKPSLNFGPEPKKTIQIISPATPPGQGPASLTEASAPQNEPDKKEFDFFRMFSQMLHPASTPTPGGQVIPSSMENSTPFVVSAKIQGEKKKDFAPHTVQEVNKESSGTALTEETQILQEELKEAVANEKKNMGLPTYEEAHKKALEVEKLLNETILQKQQLEKEILDLKKRIETQKGEVYTPSPTPLARTPNVRTIANKSQGKSAGLPTIPEFPNIITGIIKDPRGNPLSNILVEVKDPDGNPVRAFKTNPLGQFQASTPLQNGNYTIEFEDPASMNKFDKVAFQATGDIILPIEVFSIDTREELRKTLFTN